MGGAVIAPALVVIASLLAQDAPPTTAEGLTLDLWQLEGALPSWPRVISGQTPNVSKIVTNLESIRDAIVGPEGPHKDHFAGVVRGWLQIEQPGRYNLRLVGDDGARLFIDGALILDSEDRPSFVDEGGADLRAGLLPFRLEFYEDSGKFFLSLQWSPPGEVGYVAIPLTCLRTDAGQTFVVSPGSKRHEPEGELRAPGDGKPLEEVHPAYILDALRPEGFAPHVGALCPLKDGRLAVATWDASGSIWILDPRAPKGSPASTPHLFASGLGEPLGLLECDGGFLAMQKGELTRVTDVDGDAVADRYEAVASGWPHSANYHEFTFNLVASRGRVWFASSVPLRGGLTDYLPGSDGDLPVSEGPGSLWSIDPTCGELRREARGLRTPNGLGIGPDGELFGCDNQGSWLPASRLNHLVPGGFYGHQERRGGTEQSMSPVAWFPHGEIGNSPSEPILVTDGPHRGQMYVGDVTYGGIQRLAVSKVNGVYQGTVFMHSQGLEAGVNRLAWGRSGDRALYVGGIGSNGNWNHRGRTVGLERLLPAWSIEAGPDALRSAAFEMLRIDATPDGVLVTLSTPVDPSLLSDLRHFRAVAWHYEPRETYGGPKVGQHSIEVKAAQPSEDGRQVRLTLDAIQKGEVLSLRLVDVTDVYGRPMWATESWSTVNEIPAAPLPFSRFVGSPAPTENALVLFDGTGSDPLAQWQRTDGAAADWESIDGGLVTPTVGEIGDHDLVTKATFEDVFVHLEWLSPPGGDVRDGQKNGNGGIKIQSRYEIQIMNTPGAPHPPKFNEAGSIYRQRAADVNASTGAGTWQTYDIWFTAPRWDGSAKRANARMTVLWNGILVHDNIEVTDKTGMSAAEAPGAAPLLIQAHPSEAEGPVRLRNIWCATGGATPPRH